MYVFIFMKVHIDIHTCGGWKLVSNVLIKVSIATVKHHDQNSS